MKTTAIFLITLFVASASLSQDQSNGRANFQISDHRLNDAYQMLLAAKRTDTLFVRNLRASQRAWVQFRDAEFTLKYPAHGSIDKPDFIPLDQSDYLARLTESRTATLIEWLKTVTGGLVEHGQVKNQTRNEPAMDDIHREVYVSDMTIIASDHVHDGIGLDKPYWGGKLVIRRTIYDKGVFIHPDEGGVVAYVEFLLPKEGGRLEGVAGYCEESGVFHRGMMKFRIIGDGQPLLAGAVGGPQSRMLRVNLGHTRVLRIEAEGGGVGDNADHIAFGDLKVVYE
jgi:uncharacterized protein YecT (DUF1311 family)